VSEFILRAVVALLCLAIYGLAAWWASSHSSSGFSRWPTNPVARRIWAAWVIFLLALSPLSFHAADMQVWLNAMQAAMVGARFTHDYVYLPVYAQLLAAIALPFHILGINAVFVALYIVRAPVVIGYVVSAHLMSVLATRDSAVAPLAIVLSPVTLFYIFSARLTS
jgi:hypothetical protein